MGLAKEHRLRHWRDFQLVYQQGIRYRASYLILWALPVTPTKVIPTQIGIVISQKVSKKAVVRNRLKRQIKASFKQLLPLISDNWQLVIVVRTNAVGCESEHFLRELKQLLLEAEVIHGH